jgi:hypothetical protein
VPYGDLPRINALDGVTLARARIVVMHSPQSVELPPSDAGPAERAALWAVTLTDIQGMALGREHVTVPDFPTPQDEIVRLHLDLVGLRVEGSWVTDLGHDDLPRHAARVVRDQRRD